MTNSIIGIIIITDINGGELVTADINEVILNPVRIRIIQEAASRQSITASELCECISDVPRTTLYRHINILLDNNILTVVSEKKIRGSLERTLALNTGELTKHNTLENASRNAFGFLINRYIRFHNYLNGEHPDPGRDKIFFNNTVLLMDDSEFDAFLSELRELIIKYSNKAAKGRKARDISIISSPVEEYKGEK